MTELPDHVLVSDIALGDVRVTTYTFAVDNEIGVMVDFASDTIDTWFCSTLPSGITDPAMVHRLANGFALQQAKWLGLDISNVMKVQGDGEPVLDAMKAVMVLDSSSYITGAYRRLQ